MSKTPLPFIFYLKTRKHTSAEVCNWKCSKVEVEETPRLFGSNLI